MSAVKRMTERLLAMVLIVFCRNKSSAQPELSLMARKWSMAAFSLLCYLVVAINFEAATSTAFSQAKAGAQSNRKAIVYYSDAAGYQNKGAYKLAIEEWKKLLDEFPDDPLASKAWHYMGVCYTQLDTPDYEQASNAFQSALKDAKLEVREESLINLSWCLFSQARAAKPDSPDQRSGLEQAKTQLTTFLKSYGDSSYIDQALFYLGEIEYTLGNIDRSIPYYKKLIDTDALRESSLRPGAVYALSVAFEEAKQEPTAIKYFRQFLTENPQHRLANEVTMRLADLLLKAGDSKEAATLLSGLSASGDEKLTDYALLRLAYALSTQGNSDAAMKNYQRLLDEFPSSKHVWTARLSLGQLLFDAGRYADAAQQFEQSLEAKDDQAAEAAHRLAITLMRQNQPQIAADKMRSVLQWAGETPSAVALQMDYADALYVLPDKLDEARQAYERIAEANPKHPLAPRAAYNAAFAALQAGNVADARKWSEWFLVRFPQDPLRNDVAAVAAEALLQQGEHGAAAQAYAALRDKDRNNPAFNRWSLRLGMSHYMAGDYPAAIKLLESEVPRLNDAKQKAEALFILGASQLYSENISAAIDLLKRSHTTNEDWSSADEVLLILAEAYERNKDNVSAKKTLELLLQKYPKTRLKVQVDYKLAQLSAALNEFQQAIDQYRSIAANRDASSYHNFAAYGVVWCLMQQEKYEQALAQLQPLLAQQLTDSIGNEAKLAKGVCLRKIGNNEQAITALESFLATQPIGMSLANGLNELALAYTQQGELKKATAAFERLLREVPNFPGIDRVLYELAWNYQDNSDSKTAAKYFEQLNSQFPASEFGAEAAYMLAQQQYEEKRFNAAESMYTSVLNRTRDAELLEKTQYKLAWSLFQQERYPQAAVRFSQQYQQFPSGPLAVDALFMLAECDFKADKYEAAVPKYVKARDALEKALRESNGSTAASEQVQALIYLHGAQCYRELARWDECESWLNVIKENYAQSPYLWTAVYELGYCKQQQDDAIAALKLYDEVLRNNRNELGARARFMMGEVYFSKRDFPSAIKEFTGVAYGFGGDRAPEDVKNWQAKSAFEAARCYEVLIADLQGEGREKAVREARKFYEDIVRDHAAHELARQASTRLNELQKLR